MKQSVIEDMYQNIANPQISDLFALLTVNQ